MLVEKTVNINTDNREVLSNNQISPKLALKFYYWALNSAIPNCRAFNISAI